MSPIWVTKQTAVPNIPGGTYTLEFTNVREVQVDDFERAGEKSLRTELTFTIRDDPRWQGQSFSDLATPRMGPKTKLTQIFTALNGDVPLPDGDIDLEAFIGRRLRATIRRKENGFNQIIGETAMPIEPTNGRDD